MLYRQNSQPNCNIYLSDDLSTMTVQANQNIKPGTLLTINKASIKSTLVESLAAKEQEFTEEDLGDDEEFMKKMASLIESQNNS